MDLQTAPKIGATVEHGSSASGGYQFIFTGAEFPAAGPALGAEDLEQFITGIKLKEFAPLAIAPADPAA